MTDIIRADQLSATEGFVGAELVLGEHADLVASAEKIEALESKIDTIEIRNDKDAADMNNLLAVAKATGTALEGERKARKAPILTEGRAIDACFKPAAAALARIERATKLKLRDHLQRKRIAAAKREEEARKLREAAQRAALDAKNAAEEAAANEAMIKARQAAPVDPNPTRIRSTLATLTTRMVPKVKIHDITKVPNQYLVLALQKDMKPLERVLLKVKDEDVPGCEFYEDEELSQRVGR